MERAIDRWRDREVLEEERRERETDGGIER